MLGCAHTSYLVHPMRRRTIDHDSHNAVPAPPLTIRSDFQVLFRPADASHLALLALAPGYHVRAVHSFRLTRPVDTPTSLSCPLSTPLLTHSTARSILSHPLLTSSLPLSPISFPMPSQPPLPSPLLSSLYPILPSPSLVLISVPSSPLSCPILSHFLSSTCRCTPLHTNPCISTPSPSPPAAHQQAPRRPRRRPRRRRGPLPRTTVVAGSVTSAALAALAALARPSAAVGCSALPLPSARIHTLSSFRSLPYPPSVSPPSYSLP